MPNQLLHSTSLYLRQHANQPVDWHPWNKQSLQLAQKHNKPILLSIGYAACHWCHVMARETFSDPEAASRMNEYFICIKVDREERPDIDQVYASALSAMGLPVGWPMHLFLLPDQRPFYGGLYFPIDTWKQVIQQAGEAFIQHTSQLVDSATQFTKTLNEQSFPTTNHATNIDLQQTLSIIYQHLDHQHGGIKGAPKFPSPSLHNFLLLHATTQKDKRAADHLHLTLRKMAYGGIYDQLGGGFARYTTDDAWKDPHFEKMLYDNGQLISLYAQAYATYPTQVYKHVVQETVQFVQRELMSDAGGFYSAISAESEKTAGKFYTWTQKEIKDILQTKSSTFLQWLNVDTSKHAGVLYRTRDESDDLATREELVHSKKKLLAARAQRIAPLRDEKYIASWNAMMIQGLIDAYKALHEPAYLQLAKRAAQFAIDHLQKGDVLHHSYTKGMHGELGYLEDYAWVIKAWISLYQASLEEDWLSKAKALTEYTLAHFYDESRGFFRFADSTTRQLIAPTVAIFDELAPSPNAVMAHNLFDLGMMLDHKNYTAQALQMLQRMTPYLDTNAIHCTHWLALYTRQIAPAIVVALVGPDYKSWARTLWAHLPANAWIVGTNTHSYLPWLTYKTALDGKTTAYICHQNTCQAPIQNIEHVIAALKDQPYQ